MSRVVPSHDEGHLIVAGIRVMAHREGRPPLLDDVAAEIGMPADVVRVLVLEMEKLGIVRQLTAAFETRLAVDDHVKLEELPREGAGARLNSEVEEFRRAFKEKQNDLKDTFGSGAFRKKTEDKMSRLEEELKKYKSGRGGSGPSPSKLDERYNPEDDE